MRGVHSRRPLNTTCSFPILQFNPRDKNWLQNSAYNPRKKNVVLIHGYASGDQDPPFAVLRRAYERTGRYNVFLVDYSSLNRPPCYVSAVNNLRYIGRCVANYLNGFRTNGLHVDKLTCTGHSLGAITCGLLRNHLQFQLNKIIALDPAWPLIIGDLRLTKSSARVVHVLQTNAGHYGQLGPVGHVNVCVNSGYIQPYCFGTRHPHLCSHIRSLCYMAQSLFPHKKPLTAKKCFTFCPNLGIFKFMIKSEEIKVINNVPPTASGTYCLENANPPYCPKYLNGFGDDMCCRFV
ncbi:endothelial lipase-like [Bradysia coprophila]|uniref:endothelial lipase-like n=1 Tax=Bradysia coprophila TaxID=38358 RepID=UPI00187DCA6E|nr:endothelial lipase-like [Bradysia coprophila]